MLIAEAPKSNVLIPSSKTLQSSSSFPLSLSSLSVTLSESMMEENIQNAESIISKWDVNSSDFTKLTYLFQQNRKEATDFLKSVSDLRKSMHYLIVENSTSRKLSRAQKLMQIAMKRLKKEFYQILVANRSRLHPESVSSLSSGGSSYSDEDDEIRPDSEPEITGEHISEMAGASELAMSDLKSIADCMISSGYKKECVKVYKIIRKSIIDGALYRLGTERFKISQVQKMNSESLEHLIKNWMVVVKIALRKLFRGERILCDHVFSSSEEIRDSCFSQITTEGGINLFKFPDLITKNKKGTERIFRLLDLHEAVSDLWPEIESIFEFSSTSAIKSQAQSSLFKLRDSIRAIVSEFESTIQKDSSKSLIFGGGIHPLTRSAMTFIAALADYSGTLSFIITDITHSENPKFDESYFEILFPDDSSTPFVATHLAWLILVLLCKLDTKAQLYRDVSLSYLFLANNLQLILEKVSKTNLKYLFGDSWISIHRKRVKLYASNYESTGWFKVLSSLQESNSSAIFVRECFKKFNSAFEEAYRKQTSWIVNDSNLRDELKVSIANKLLPKYREFYDKNVVRLSGERNLELLIRFSPDDLGNYLSDLFHGTSSSGSSSSSSSLFNSRGCLPSLPR